MIRGYDNWKTANPYDNEVEEPCQCENCQQEFLGHEMEDAGKLRVCTYCKEEVEAKQKEVNELLKPILSLKTRTLQRKLKTEKVMSFLPKEQALRWIKQELKEQYSIEKEKVRVEELTADECECVIEILDGLYQNNESLKNSKKVEIGLIQ